MSFKTKPRRATPKFEKVCISGCSAGLARTHKIIRIEKEKEILFMKICSQIKLNDFKEKRSDSQREERRLKRIKKYSATITE